MRTAARVLIFFSMSVFQENLLKGKVAFVTGGGSGIGQRMAERFAEHSAKVVLAGRKQEKLDAAASAICAAGGAAETATLDVRDYTAVAEALRKLVAAGPPLHPERVRGAVADSLGLPESRVRVIADDVGGAFGVRGELYPEDFLVAVLAMRAS